MKRSLTGIRASGNVHIGNYLGAIKPALERQTTHQCIYFIADMHSLTTTKDPAVIREKSLDVAATWITLGLDYKKNIIFRQSDIAIVNEYTWYLSSVLNVSMLEKAHAYKDAQANNKETNHATFAYPVLMAADILMYEPDIVPVGKDQKQHVEMARDMAGAFNAVYGENLIKLPQPLIEESVMIIPGLDGRKMSKSYGNEIPLFCDEAKLKKLIMSITTDSTALEEKKILKGSLIGDLFGFFADKARYSDLESRLAAGGMGWGHAKQELFELINDTLKEDREKYIELRKDEKLLNDILDEGARKGFAIAEPNLNKLRKAVGFKASNLKIL